MSIFKLLPKFYGETLVWTSVPKNISAHISAHACTSYALKKSKELKKAPLILAKELADFLEKSNNEYIKEVFVSAPGYVNIVLNESAFEEAFVLEKHNKSVCIEYVSANPTGNLHIGHGKQGVIGSVLSNVYKAKGYKVTKMYYYNDCGKQIKLLISSVLQEIFKENLVIMPESPFLYKGGSIKQLSKKVKEIFFKDNNAKSTQEPIHEGTYSHSKKADFCSQDSVVGGCGAVAQCKELMYEYESVEKIIDKIEAFVVLTIKGWQFDTLNKMNINFDKYVSESDLYKSGTVKEVVEQWEKNGLLKKKDGATFMDINGQEVVVQKSTGDFTYFVPDVALHKNKILSYDKIVNIQGVDHCFTKDKVLYGIKSIGLNGDKIEYVLHKMVNVFEGGQLVKQSKRAGSALDIDCLLESVDVDSLKFYLLSNSSEKDLDINIEDLKKMDETNPVWYVKMTYAKYNSLIEKNLDLNSNNKLTPLPETLELIMSKVIFIDDSLEAVTTLNAPHLIYQMLMELSLVMNQAYVKMPKLNSMSPEQSKGYGFWLPKVLKMLGELMDMANIKKVQRISKI